jgi:hypothetical protein
MKKEKIDFSIIKKAVLKGLRKPMLPDNIDKFYNKLIVRVFRVIGGACAVLVLTNNYIFIPYP